MKDVLPISSKQELFCQEYLKDLNGTQAAIRAGYSANGSDVQATRLLANASVRARVDELLAKRSNKLEITAEKVLRDIEETRVRCMQGERVLDREGIPTGEWKFEAHAALKASELQGKHIKLFTEKIEHSGKMTFDALPEEELDRRIQTLLEAKKTTA